MVLDGITCLVLSMIIYVLLNFLFQHLYLLCQILLYVDIHTKLLAPYLLERKSSLFNCYSKNSHQLLLLRFFLPFFLTSHHGLKDRNKSLHNVTCKLLRMEQAFDGEKDSLALPSKHLLQTVLNCILSYRSLPLQVIKTTVSPDLTSLHQWVPKLPLYPVLWKQLVAELQLAKGQWKLEKYLETIVPLQWEAARFYTLRCEGKVVWHVLSPLVEKMWKCNLERKKIIETKICWDRS